MSDKELEKAVNTESAENTEEKTSRNFIEQMIDKDLAEGVYDTVHIRWVPEGNGCVQYRIRPPPDLSQ